MVVGIPRGAFRDEDPRVSVLDELAELGVEFVDVDLPEYPTGAMMILLNAEAACAFDELTRDGRDEELVRQTASAWPNSFRASRLIPAVEYIRAQRVRTLLIQDMREAMAEVDVLVHPSFAGNILSLTNLTGHPTFVAPCGFRDDGTPFSISFTGRLFGDADVLALARAWQAATDYEDRHPSEPGK
jgi:Asp-tRNA(Asn)/Glu-tRNA(Gln) amidotransferase A subunit family amidase